MFPFTLVEAKKSRKLQHSREGGTPFLFKIKGTFHFSLQVSFRNVFGSVKYLARVRVFWDFMSYRCENLRYSAKLQHSREGGTPFLFKIKGTFHFSLQVSFRNVLGSVKYLARVRVFWDFTSYRCENLRHSASSSRAWRGHVLMKCALRLSHCNRNNNLLTNLSNVLNITFL